MRKLACLCTVLLLLLCTVASAQNRTITGTVKDNAGDPIPFASIKIKGSNTGISADENGFFRITVPANTSLEISAVGSEPQTLTLPTTGDVLNVTLTRTSDLRAVVVTTSLGIKRQAKELGYAATSINNKTLTQAKAVNVQQALNGKVSGVSVATINSGVFENAKINIRGIRSLTGNNQPMLLVDGAPTPLGFLSSIPPDDIQDVTVLKSAASAAIYGPDAVNGVIVVTTKRGNNNRLMVTVNSSVQAARVAYFPKLQKRFGSGAGETVDAFGNYLYVPYENQQYGPEFDGSMVDLGVPLEDGSIQKVPYTNGRYKDKVDFWNTGLTLQNSISVSGQDFYFSIDDANIKGLMPDDENRRTSFRFSGGKKSGKFNINYGLNYVLQNYDVVNEAGLTTLYPGSYNGSIFFLVLQTPSHVPLLDYKDWRNSKFAQPSNYYNEYAANPYWIIGNIRQKGREDDLIGNLDLGFQFTPWLKANVRVSSTLAFNNFQNNTAALILSDWAQANRSPNSFSNQRGSTLSQESFNSRINVDYFVNGDRTIGRDFGIKYILGGMVRQNRSKTTTIGGNNLVVPYLYNPSVRSGVAEVGLNNNVQSRLLSAYGSVGFNYKEWAFVEVTGRNDWDSRLLKENRSFFYPGANASVVLSDALSSIKNSNLISYAKVRVAYSKSGNVNIGVYALQPTYSQPAGFPYNTNAGFSADNAIPSPDLKPEFVITKEIGFELGFLKNRFNFEASFFDQRCNNQILRVSQSAATGYTVGIANAASFKNYGVEMDLGLTPLINVGKGKIDFRINATYNNNEVLSTLGNVPVVIGGNVAAGGNPGFLQNSISSPTANNIAVVGRPAFAFQLSDYARDPQGRVIVDRLTGMPSQGTELITTGRTLPLWVIGATPSFTLGNFSVSMTWDYKGGHNFYSGLGSDADFAGISKRSAEYGRKRFVFPNSSYWDGNKYVENTSIQVQSGNYEFWANGTTNESIGTNYYASADAIRLREVNISYTLPNKWIGNGKVVKRVTVALIGKNLLLFVPESNQWGDPEFNYSATGNTFGLASSFQSPASRLFGGTLTVQF
jgi:TonB-linked SusC/RagA family outer membrane protein